MKINSNSTIGSVASFLSRGWEIITNPTNARCELYKNQADTAQKNMQKENISICEKNFWVNQNDQAITGLKEVHHTNKNAFVSIICIVGAGLFLVNIV